MTHNLTAMPLLIKNGTLFTATDTFKADILTDGEAIVQIGQSIPVQHGTPVLDATDRYVFPGGVDPHTHLDSPSQGTTTADDFWSGTVAAACGGTTSIVDFCFPSPGQAL